MLYISRGIAGIGIGGITNLTNIIISDVVTLERRGKFQGILGSMVGIGSVSGPFLAAAFVSRSTWRGFFWLLAPLGVLTAVVAYFYLPSKAPSTTFKEGARRVDYLGTLTMSVGTIFLLIPVSGGGAYFAWGSPLVISMLVIGGIALGSFLVVEWKFANIPMMPRKCFVQFLLSYGRVLIIAVNIYRDPMVVILLSQSFILGFVYQSTIYYVPLYLQNARRLSIIVSAAIFSSLVAMQAVMSIASGAWISWRKQYGWVIRFGFAMWTL